MSIGEGMSFGTLYDPSSTLNHFLLSHGDLINFKKVYLKNICIIGIILNAFFLSILNVFYTNSNIYG